MFSGIDASGATDKAKNSVDGLLERTKLIDVISLKYGIHKEPNNYMRDQKRTDFLFCSEHIYTFLDKCDITPFNEVPSSDYRRIFLNLRLGSFLKSPIFPYLTISLDSSNLSIIKASPMIKNNLNTYITKQYIIKKSNIFQKNLLIKNITHHVSLSINKSIRC